jgi:hypothetical protein
MRDFAKKNCRANEAVKRRLVADENIAARTKEICDLAGER